MRRCVAFGNEAGSRDGVETCRNVLLPAAGRDEDSIGGGLQVGQQRQKDEKYWGDSFSGR